MANPVTITVEITLKPEATAAFCAQLPEIIKDTAKRPGFRDIHIVSHKDNPSRVCFIETWDSEQQYHDYVAWRTERGDMESMGSVIAAPPSLNVWPKVVASG